MWRVECRASFCAGKVGVEAILCIQAVWIVVMKIGMFQ